MAAVARVRVIDSHTEGEPTRVIALGEIELGPGPIASRVARMKQVFDQVFRPLVLEPRAGPAFVGVWFGTPSEPGCLHDVIFFNSAGPLGMCGHGTMGFMVTLRHMNMESQGRHRLNTIAGPVTAELIDDQRVRVENVPSYVIEERVMLNVMGYGEVQGQVAYGGNTFFLVERSPVPVWADNLEDLFKCSRGILQAVHRAGFGDVDHVELFGPPTVEGADSKSYVLCPDGTYDRSPCGTGTSAKLACLAAAGKLAPGAIWTQESILGTTFRASYERKGDKILPTIEGTAFVTGESHLIFSPSDPLREGIVLE